MILDYKYFDDRGLMHHVENPTEDSSENEILFTSEYLLLYRDELQNTSLGSLLNDYTGSIPNSYEKIAYPELVNRVLFFYQTEKNNNKRISHDNKTGLVSVYPQLTESIFRVGKRLWLHPRDIVYYGYKKYGFWFYPLLPVVSISNIISCYRTYKVHPDGRKEVTTSGKLLALVRNLGADLRLTQKICTFLIKRNKNFKSWGNVGKIYFGYRHPITRALRGLDGD